MTTRDPVVLDASRTTVSVHLRGPVDAGRVDAFETGEWTRYPAADARTVELRRLPTAVRTED